MDSLGFRDWFQREFKLRGHSVRTASEEIGVTRDTIRELLRRSGSTKLENAQRIARAWGYSLDKGAPNVIDPAAAELSALAARLTPEYLRRLVEDARIYRAASPEGDGSAEPGPEEPKSREE